MAITFTAVAALAITVLEAHVTSTRIYLHRIWRADDTSVDGLLPQIEAVLEDAAIIENETRPDGLLFFPSQTLRTCDAEGRFVPFLGSALTEGERDIAVNVTDGMPPPQGNS